MWQFIARALIACVIVGVIVFGAHGYYTYVTAKNSAGFFTVGDLVTGILRPALVAIFTMLGLLSSAFFSSIQEFETDLKTAVAKSMGRRSLVLAAVVAPIVICSMYERLAQLPSAFLATLFSYQNGFFWESVVGPLKRRDVRN